MTILVSDNFNTDNSFNSWSGQWISTGNAVAYSSAFTFDGSQVMKSTIQAGAAGNNGYACLYKNIAGNNPAYCRVYAAADAMPPVSQTLRFVQFTQSVGTTALIHLCFYNDAGILKWHIRYYNNGAFATATGTTCALNTYYCCEVAFYKGAAADGWLKVWIDGALTFDIGGLTTSRSLNEATVGCSFSYSTAETHVYIENAVASTEYIGPVVLPGSAGVWVNDLFLGEPRIRCTERQSTNTWAVAKYTSPFTERTAQQPTDYGLTFNLYGDNRYLAAASITAEVNSSDRLFIDGRDSEYITGKKMYGKNSGVWLNMVTCEFNESGGKKLEGNLKGNVDADIIHTCNMIIDWAGGVFSTSDNSREGKTCLQVIATGTQTAEYTPDYSLDFILKEYVRFWLFADTHPIVQLVLQSSAGNYFAWNCDYTSGCWNCIECDIDDPDETVGVPDITAITSVGIKTTAEGAYVYRLDEISAF